jgi:tRNA-2-methylthio-N6-dimethylallyladenosine synthase
VRKVYLRTYGCQMNEYDSEKISDVLRAAEGFEPAARPEDADLVVFNTCSVREKAQEKVFADLGRVKRLKREKPGLMIAVGGCVASQEGGAIVERAPYVDVVFGPQTLHRLPQLLQRRRESGRPQVDVSFPEVEKFDHLPPPRTQGAQAFVSIMEGCSKYCSFCVVPYTRGEEVSRPFEDVMREVAALCAQGVKEVTLLGQNVNAWRGTLDGQPADFAELLYFLDELPGLERIRYTTSHPREFTQRLIDVHAELDKLAPHVHLPVQSGSDRVLARMAREYTAARYEALVDRLRERVPGIALSTDVIVGFPGEDDDDFAATEALLRRVRYDAAFLFRYSSRDGTRAARWPDDVPDADKACRLERLIALQETISAERNRALLGADVEVLVEGPARRPEGWSSGKTPHMKTVVFPGPTAPGTLVRVRVGAATSHTLTGTPVVREVA